MKNLFLDRDGVLNRDDGYTHIFNERLIYEDVVCLGRLRVDRVIIVTNQSGINRGYYSEQEFHLFMSEMLEHLKKKCNLLIDRYYFCPHDPTREVCKCRKPLPGLLLDAVADLNLSPEDCIFVGDKVSDVIAGISAGFSRSILLNRLGDVELRSSTSNLLIENNTINEETETIFSLSMMNKFFEEK